MLNETVYKILKKLFVPFSEERCKSWPIRSQRTVFCCGVYLCVCWSFIVAVVVAIIASGAFTNCCTLIHILFDFVPFATIQMEPESVFFFIWTHFKRSKSFMSDTHNDEKSAKLACDLVLWVVPPKWIQRKPAIFPILIVFSCAQQQTDYSIVVVVFFCVAVFPQIIEIIEFGLQFNSFVKLNFQRISMWINWTASFPTFI